MSFSVAVFFLFVFAVSWNWLDFMRIRWVNLCANKGARGASSLEYLYAGLTSVVVVFVFVYSCLYAYFGFSKYSSEFSPLVPTMFFLVCTFIIFKKLYDALREFVRFVQYNCLGK